MRLRFHDGDMQVEALVGARSIVAAQPRIEALRRRCGQAADVMTSLHRVQRWNAIHDGLPVALLMVRHGALQGVVWLSFRRKYGVPVGLVRSGNLCGQGSVIGHADDRPAMLETAARVLLRRPLAHTVLLSSVSDGCDAHGPDKPVAGVDGSWHFRAVRYRLDLAGGVDATMERLGYKMRRNLRYYRRRAEEGLGVRFVPEMTAAQRRSAVDALHDRGPYRTGARWAAATEAALLETPGQFAMGLQDRTGAWVSYVAGWREPGGTCIDWQLNHDGYPNASLSTVMRAFLLEHEAARGSPALVFVGLTSEFWSRVCEPATCGDLVATRRGLAGSLARWLTRRLSPNGQIAGLHARAAMGAALGSATGRAGL